MSSDQDAIQRRYREFLDLLPMTLTIAGLSPAEGARSFTQEQMEARANVINSAFKIARRAVREAIKSS